MFTVAHRLVLSSETFVVLDFLLIGLPMTDCQNELFLPVTAVKQGVLLR